MNKYIALIGVLVLSGCQFMGDGQNFEDRLSERIMESTTGDEMNIEGVGTDNMTIETEMGTIDLSGMESGEGVFRITDEEGNVVSGSGDDVVVETVEGVDVVIEDGELVDLDTSMLENVEMPE